MLNEPPEKPAEDPGVSASSQGRHSSAATRIIVVAVALLLVVLGYFAQPWLKLLGPPERCWELREIDGRIYRMNPCTGQFRLIGDVETTADK